MVRVIGLVVCRLPLIDGRPGQSPAQVAEMVRHFRPATVPIVSRHYTAELLGYLNGLEATDRWDLLFTGEIAARPDLVARLRSTGVSVSIEINYRGSVLPAPHPGREYDAKQPHFLGRLADGATLVGVALTDTPAAPGSLLVADPESAVAEARW